MLKENFLVNFICAEEKVRVEVNKVYKLEEVVEALEQIETLHSTEKIVIRP